MVCSPPSNTKAACLFLILCTLIRASDATIQVVQDGTEFLSRPDHNLGLQMKEGMEYYARIQVDHGGNRLCRGPPLHIKVPDDGRPVAMLVHKGDCSFAQKAEWASRNIHPKGIVKILIIDGETRIKDEEHEVNPKALSSEHMEDDKSQDSLLSSDKDHQSQDSTLSSWEFPSYYNGDNNSNLTLRRRHADDISVALLHVSYHAALEIDSIINSSPDVLAAGGILVMVNSDAPPLPEGVIFIWTGVCFVLSLLACCCLASFLEQLAESRQPEPEPPRRPRRRRLTLEQVQKYPVGVFDGNQLVYDEQEEAETMEDLESGEPNTLFLQPVEDSLDTCAICIDEYEVGDELMCLPCGHAFHVNCIARWLIERSATCPLCKIDLYEEEEEEDDDDDDDEEGETGEQEPPSPQDPPGSTEFTTSIPESVRESWWRNVFRRRRYRDPVSEALTEPLLPENEQEEESGEEEPEATPSETSSVRETPVSEEFEDEEPASREDESATESNSE
eukprot:CAMPEP_0116132634 /NCGR_PEP_ID=MMETSP0329-20121206/9658_1 /TAXON_ID=697910 /ORGANISM="Pseudo-nitzschia arenysensis, Strain B593" /LENGTH=503 /DNA_ID=CAMNT_0003627173 /DNA_START=159 /DNA_END=1670 /DNA_ORIENTATION=+